jgi:hypothetical protein
MSKSGRPCAHDEVIWDAIQIEYNGEGTADIIQEGNCEQCVILPPPNVSHS